MPPNQDEQIIPTRQKALTLNLDATSYGTFAEIGGGQEVSRWFFAVGGAAGTVAETVSAYDKAVSDRLYGHTTRYVSRDRLGAMLDQEFNKLREGLQANFGDAKRFFAFADTVATRSYQKGGHGHGWLGIRFQTEPRGEPSDIIIHANLLDSTAAGEQAALGILGVNLIYGAFFLSENPAKLIASLMDDLSRERVEIDMVELTGSAFPNVDHRLMSLQLVEGGLTDAAMFMPGGKVVQPADVLYKKPILVGRGSFRPPTNLTLDVLQRATQQFLEEPEVRGKTPVVLAEMTLRSLTPGQEAGHEDFLARADILCALGLNVLISRFGPYYQLADYLAASTNGFIGIAVGLPTILEQLADEKYYTDLPGGVLEATGRLHKRSVKMYVHPTRDLGTNQIQTLETAPPPPPWHHLGALLIETGKVVPIRSYNESYLSIHTPDVLARIQREDSSWEKMVPAAVAEVIKTKNLFRSR